MSETPETPLQTFIRKAIANAPRARDFYDKRIQEATGTSGKPIYDLQRGKSTAPNAATLGHIAKALGQPLHLLASAANGEHVEPIPAKLLPPDPPEGHVTSNHHPTIKADDGSIALRHLDMSLSMGDGSNIDDYFEEGTFEFDANLLRTISRAPADRLIVGHGVGDSMNPTLHDRDLVIFDTTQTVLNTTDKIWAISLFGAGGIKRLRPIARDRVLVISDNPALENQEVSTEDLRIMGRVIWSARRH